MSSALSRQEVLQGMDYDQNWTVKGALCLATVEIQTLLPPPFKAELKDSVSPEEYRLQAA